MGNGYPHSANGDGATDVVLNYFFPFSQKNTIPRKSDGMVFCDAKIFYLLLFLISSFTFSSISSASSGLSFRTSFTASRPCPNLVSS